MRKSGMYRFEPTVRTAVSLARLLFARQLRIGFLTGDDYLECAQLVTPPEDKIAAQKIALNVLSAPLEFPAKGSRPTEESSALAEILAEMELAKTLEDVKDPALINESVEDLLLDPGFNALLDEVGGVEAAKARFAGAKELKQYGADLVTDRMGGLSREMFKLAIKLGMGEAIASESSSEAESEAAKVILAKKSVGEAVNQIESFDLRLKTLGLLSASRVDIQDDLQALADSAKTLEQLGAISAMGHVDIDRGRLFDAINASMTDHSFEELFERTESLAFERAMEAKGHLYDVQPDLSEQQLSEHALLCVQWKEALERAVERRIEKAKESSYDEGLSLLNDLFSVTRSQGDPVLSQHLHEGLQGAAKGVLHNAGTLDQMLQLLQITDQMGCGLLPKDIRTQGYEIGMSRQEMDQILHSRLALIKRMIEKGESVFDRFSRLIEKEQPNKDNTIRLTDLAVKKANTAALAALGHYNLEWALEAGADQKDGVERIVESLSAGPGSNLLTQWFTHRDKISGAAKEPLRRLARDVLVQYAVSLGKQMIGDRSTGVLEGESVRAFVPGDDPSLIDMDETIQNIVDQGKPLALIAPEDLRVRETVHGRRAVALLVDISGSMEGEKLTWCAIAASMLAYALRPDELALAFFESDTHVVKAFNDKMEIEEIVDELLGLKSRGGTVLSKALDWIVDQTKSIGFRRKNALILTDAAIFDMEDCSKHCQLLGAMHVSTTWFVPKSDWAQSEAAALARWSRGGVVRLNDQWRRFPALISEALR
jgi:Mg-chelatase subunit ChlD